MTNTIIKYALDLATDSIVFIDNAERKLYRCRGCQKELIPVKGDARKKEWHFRHQIDSDCKGGQETYVHQIAKQVIINNTKITIPKYGAINYTDAIAEKELISKRPDVTAIYKGQKIYFEVAVKHFIEHDKSLFFTNGQHKSVEIDLSELPLTSSPAEIENAVLNEFKNKRIIYWEQAPEPVFKNPRLNPFAILGYIIVGLLLLYGGYKSLTRKNRS